MIVGVYQKCKYNVKNMKNWLCIFIFLTLIFILTNSMSELRFNQNCSLIVEPICHWKPFKTQGAAI